MRACHKESLEHLRSRPHPRAKCAQLSHLPRYSRHADKYEKGKKYEHHLGKSQADEACEYSPAFLPSVTHDDDVPQSVRRDNLASSDNHSVSSRTSSSDRVAPLKQPDWGIQQPAPAHALPRTDDMAPLGKSREWGADTLSAPPLTKLNSDDAASLADTHRICMDIPDLQAQAATTEYTQSVPESFHTYSYGYTPANMGTQQQRQQEEPCGGGLAQQQQAQYSGDAGSANPASSAYGYQEATTHQETGASHGGSLGHQDAIGLAGALAEGVLAKLQKKKKDWQDTFAVLSCKPREQVGGDDGARVDFAYVLELYASRESAANGEAAQERIHVTGSSVKFVQGE